VDSVTGQPLDGAEVTIASVANLEEQQALFTSSTGRFLFANLPPGKYRLMASRRGYTMQAFHQHEGFSTGIVVGPGLDSEHFRFPLAPSSVITGVVTDEWGDPVRDAKVLLFQQSTFEGSRGLRNVNQHTTDDQGRYRFAHLLTGTYAVAVFAHPWYTQPQMQIQAVQGSINFVDLNAVVDRSTESPIASGGGELTPPDPLFDVVYPVTFFSNATSLAQATRIALAPGATETADFQLRPVPSVHLRMRVPTQRVTLDEGAEQTANQGESGNYLRDIPAPDVGLALKIGDGFFTDQIEPARKEIAPGIVEFSGIPPGQFEVSLSNGSMLTDRDDSIVSQNRTLSVSADSELDLSSQGDSGIVSGKVLASQFPQAIATAKPAPADPAASDHATREQTAVDQSASGEAAPEEAARIQALQERMSNATLTLRSLKTGETYDATISGRGQFTIAGATLPAGSYDVEFSGQSQLHVSALEATGATVSGHIIEILSGQPVNLVVHAAEANCTLSGIALKNGKPVADAMVLLVPQDPGHDTSLYHRDQSDSDGSFTMSPLFPGRYILLAIENGWDLEWADPKVMFQYLPGGQPLELQPGASLTLNAKVQ
jgi:hypothetical protein